MGVVAVSTKPDPAFGSATRARPGQPRTPQCRYLRGRGAFAERCTAEPVSTPDDDSIELCPKHLGLAVAAFARITATQKDAA